MSQFDRQTLEVIVAHHRESAISLAHSLASQGDIDGLRQMVAAGATDSTFLGASVRLLSRDRSPKAMNLVGDWIAQALQVNPDVMGDMLQNLSTWKVQFDIDSVEPFMRLATQASVRPEMPIVFHASPNHLDSAKLPILSLSGNPRSVNAVEISLAGWLALGHNGESAVVSEALRVLPLPKMCPGWVCTTTFRTWEIPLLCGLAWSGSYVPLDGALRGIRDREGSESARQAAQLALDGWMDNLRITHERLISEAWPDWKSDNTFTRTLAVPISFGACLSSEALESIESSPVCGYGVAKGGTCLAHGLAGFAAENTSIHDWRMFRSMRATVSCDASRIERHAQASAQALRQLARDGVDISRPDANGKTPLHHAAQAGNVATYEALCDIGLDIRQKDNRGWTAQSYAKRRDDPYFLAFTRSRAALHAANRALESSGDGIRPL